MPAIKPAAAASTTGVIAVLATPRTATGDYLGWLIGDHAAGKRVIVVSAPELVGLVEAGQTDGPRVEASVGELLGDALREGADRVVLGCTHFPFLRPAIERVVGPGVAVVDSGYAIARRLRQVLTQAGTAAVGDRGGLKLETTGDRIVAGAAATRLLGSSILVDAAVDPNLPPPCG